MRVCALLVLLGYAVAIPAQDRSWGRSMTITRGGIVATSQTLASQAGAQILARGGSAVDAAIAANAVLGLVEPMMNGIGGDLFLLYVDGRTGKLTALNASGFTPKGLTIEAMRSKGYTYSMPSGIHTVSVPGAVNGWEKVHQKFGKLPWKDLFAPAIYYAENGFPVTELIQWDWEHATAKLAADENARKVFLNKNGEAPKVGEIFRNPQLAKAYRLIAEGGAKAYYRGPIREAILRTSERLGGTLTRQDFEDYDSEWVEPLATDYRGWKVFQLPPNGQGIGTLEMLNIMGNFKLNDFLAGDAAAWHLKIEAQKLAVQDLRRYNGDPKFSVIPVEGLLSRGYARERAASISMERANCETAPGDPKMVKAGIGHTVYLSATDRDGNMVSWIQSISDLWGSGIVVDDYGFHLHDRASGMTLEPGLPDSLAPRKRPFHTIIPGYMERGDERIVFGIMRGINQHQAQAQFVSYVADHGMNIQAALDAPRFTRRTTGGCDVMVEERVPKEVRDRLEALGHRLQVVGDYGAAVGGGQAILRNIKTGVNYGASDARKDGFAAPEPDPYFLNSSKAK